MPTYTIVTVNNKKFTVSADTFQDLKDQVATKIGHSEYDFQLRLRGEARSLTSLPSKAGDILLVLRTRSGVPNASSHPVVRAERSGELAAEAFHPKRIVEHEEKISTFKGPKGQIGVSVAGRRRSKTDLKATRRQKQPWSARRVNTARTSRMRARRVKTRSA